MLYFQGSNYFIITNHPKDTDIIHCRWDNIKHCSITNHLKCNHEEAGTIIVLHAFYAAQSGDIVPILSLDTDVLVLLFKNLNLLASLGYRHV